MEGGGNAMTSVITAITTAAGTIKDDFMSALGGVLPVALAIMGASMVIILAINAFRTVSKKR